MGSGISLLSSAIHTEKADRETPSGESDLDQLDKGPVWQHWGLECGVGLGNLWFAFLVKPLPIGSRASIKVVQKYESIATHFHSFRSDRESQTARMNPPFQMDIAFSTPAQNLAPVPPLATTHSSSRQSTAFLAQTPSDEPPDRDSKTFETLTH